MKTIPGIKYGSYENIFRAVDSHTMGEFTRIVLDGFPPLKGNSMIEKKQYLQKHCDNYRKALMLEPRGHHDMFGAVLTEPVSKEADFGVVFMETGGFLNMCGHGTIGTATVIVESGLVEVKEPYTEVVLEAPAGLIRTKVEVKNGKAVSVTLTNVPSFLYKENLEVKIEGLKIKYDIAFGGSFFVLVDTKQLNKEINAKEVPGFIDLGMKILKTVNKEVQIKHPTLDITKVDLVEFYGPTNTPGCNLRNVVVFGEGQADRSPCGTGTSAKLATLYKRGKIGIGEPFVYESFIGTKFKGVIKKETTIGGYTAVIPQVTGSAYITGESTYIIDQDDPLKYGFLIG